LEISRLGRLICSDQPREDAADVRVDRPDRLPEDQRGDGTGGVRPHAWQAEERIEVRGNAPAVLRDDGARRPLEVERAPVVAETAPRAEDIGGRGRGKAFD
jgi:hypothetical protein